MSMQTYYKADEDPHSWMMQMQEQPEHGVLTPLHYSFDSINHASYPAQLQSPQTSPTGSHPKSLAGISSPQSCRPILNYQANSASGQPRIYPGSDMSSTYDSYAQSPSPVAQVEPDSRYQQQKKQQQRPQTHMQHTIKSEYDQFPSPNVTGAMSMVSISTMPIQGSLPSSNPLLHSNEYLFTSPERETQNNLPSHVLESKPTSQNLKRNHHVGGVEEPSKWQPKVSGMAPNPKRRKSSFKEGWQMSEDDKLLMLLKDERNTPWKQICEIFREQGKGDHKEATLQMRLKRLKEKLHKWTPEDEQRLDECKKELDKAYWSLVASKMIEKGSKEKFGGSACERKWKQIENRRTSQADVKQSNGASFPTIEEPDPPNDDYDADEA